MPSQLYKNEHIYFLACKPFTYRGTEYSIGDEFDQSEANNIETMVRSRFVIPVVDDIANKPRHWHTHVRTQEQAEEYLTRSRKQLEMPTPPDSDQVVDIPTLTDPNREVEEEEQSEPEEEPPPAVQEQAEQTEAATEAVHSDAYDPSYHTVTEVNDYLAAHPDEREQILESERNGKARKGILEA